MPWSAETPESKGWERINLLERVQEIGWPGSLGYAIFLGFLVVFNVLLTLIFDVLQHVLVIQYLSTSIENLIKSDEWAVSFAMQMMTFITLMRGCCCS